MTNSSYVDGVLKKFIARHEGQYLDHSHAYGPQSPDLIEYYLTDLLGRPWQFRAGLAVGLWDDLHGVMKDFERIERGPQTQVSVDFRPGDVLVFGAALEGPGTVGVYVRPGSRVGSVQMFTQNPGPAKVVDIMADGALNKLLGGWRLTAGAECKIIADKFAAQLHATPGPAPVDPWIAEQVRRTHAKPPRDLQREINDADLRAHEPTPLPDDIAAEFDKGYAYAKNMRGKQQRARLEEWLASQDPRTAPKHRVVETTTPAEPEPGHWLKRLFLRR